jgi:hypothetical protein
MQSKINQKPRRPFDQRNTGDFNVRLERFMFRKHKSASAFTSVGVKGLELSSWRADIIVESRLMVPSPASVQ